IFTLMGAKANNALLFTASMMFIAGFGALLQGFLGDRYGRRWVHTLYMVIAAVGLLVMGGKLPVGLVAFAAGVTAFFGLGGFSIPKIYVSEQYPTRLRGTGVATGELVSRFLTGVVLVYFIPTMLATLHVETTFIILAVAMLILVAPLLFFGEETANLSVEEAGTDLHYVSPEAEASQSLLS
ncbi:MAG: MFS transporter, partial [Firmicutes bacterium]|nr:MFS transporter [Bacillota bacterium]